MAAYLSVEMMAKKPLVRLLGTCKAISHVEPNVQQNDQLLVVGPMRILRLLESAPLMLFHRRSACFWTLCSDLHSMEMPGCTIAQAIVDLNIQSQLIEGKACRRSP